MMRSILADGRGAQKNRVLRCMVCITVSSGQQTEKRERYNMDVYLIRHGKTKGNLEGRYIGTTDEPLCEEGKAKSYADGRCEKKYPAVEALFVSPMPRCRESAKILFPKQSISVVSDLRECDFGRYENKNFQELSGDADYQRWLDSNGTLPFPAGEEQSHFRKRCVKAFKTIVAELFGAKEIFCGDRRPWRNNYEYSGSTGGRKKGIL